MRRRPTFLQGFSKVIFGVIADTITLRGRDIGRVNITNRGFNRDAAAIVLAMTSHTVRSTGNIGTAIGQIAIYRTDIGQANSGTDIKPAYRMR